MILQRGAILLSLLLISLCTWAQYPAEYLHHRRSIDSTLFPIHPLDRADTTFNANSAFVDFTIRHLLQRPEDSCFIANRNLLPKLRTSSCTADSIVLEDTLLTGELCRISLVTTRFVKSQHKVVTKPGDIADILSIDGQIPYGAHYGAPDFQIASLRITLDGKPLSIPDAAFSNLYNPNICDEETFHRKVEAYSSLDGKYLYVYVYGGNAANTYFSKLVFDRQQYLTRIVAEYGALSRHASFRDGFIGF